MIDHISYYATDYEATKRFYDATLTLLGYPLAVEMKMDWDKEFPGRAGKINTPDLPIASSGHRPVYFFTGDVERESPWYAFRDRREHDI